MTVKLTIIPTTLEQYKALRDMDFSAFVDPQYILTEGVAGELAPAPAEQPAEPVKRGPGRPRKADTAPAAQEVAQPPAQPAAVPSGASSPPSVETAGEPAEAQRAAISAAMKAYMQKGDHQSLRDIVRKYSEGGTLSGVADSQLAALLADIETALLML